MTYLRSTLPTKRKGKPPQMHANDPNASAGRWELKLEVHPP